MIENSPFLTAFDCRSEDTLANATALIPKKVTHLTWSFIKLINGETMITIFFWEEQNKDENTAGKAW